MSLRDRVIQTLVKVWENSKKLWKHSPAARVPTAFLVPSNFHSCLYNSIETRYMFSISYIEERRNIFLKYSTDRSLPFPGGSIRIRACVRNALWELVFKDAYYLAKKTRKFRFEVKWYGNFPEIPQIELQMVSTISFGWFADFAKTLTIIQRSSQLVYSDKW